MTGQVLKINGQWLRDPVTLEYGLQDVDAGDGAGTNQQGLTFRDRVRTRRTVSCSWGLLDSQDMSDLLQAMNDEFFELEFPDAYTGQRQTMTVLAGAKATPCYRYVPAEDRWLWQGVSVTFTER